MTKFSDYGPHDSPYCGARKKQPLYPGETCRRPAGWGTVHAGVGRCKLHGGATQHAHGRYSKVQQHHLDAVRYQMTRYSIRTIVDTLTILIVDEVRRREVLIDVFEAAGLATRDEWPPLRDSEHPDTERDSDLSQGGPALGRSRSRAHAS
jgi:hypothetical protein